MEKDARTYVAGLRMPSVSEEARERARARWNAVAKPIGSLGALEDAVVDVAGLVGTADVDVVRRCVVVLCADNGVVAQGVSQCGPEVSAAVARAVARGTSSVCRMCAPVGVDCIAVDMGLADPPDEPRLLDRRVAAGTADITQGPAMGEGQMLRAIRVGADLVAELASAGYRLVATGEMGIGNTTTATAIACALSGMPPRDLVGRGAGLSDAGLERKRRAVARALEVNRPDADDPFDLLAKLGGFDIAGMCGMFLGAAVHRVPIVVDGLISAVAACLAVRMRPECRHAMLASHVSAEPAGRIACELLGMSPVIDAHMRLGEGTGAACLVPLLDMALSLYGGATFGEMGVEPYEVFGS